MKARSIVGWKKLKKICSLKETLTSSMKIAVQLSRTCKRGKSSCFRLITCRNVDYCSGVKSNNQRAAKTNEFSGAIYKICLMVWSDRYSSTFLYFQRDTSILLPLSLSFSFDQSFFSLLPWRLFSSNVRLPSLSTPPGRDRRFLSVAEFERTENKRRALVTRRTSATFARRRYFPLLLVIVIIGGLCFVPACWRSCRSRYRFVHVILIDPRSESRLRKQIMDINDLPTTNRNAFRPSRYKLVHSGRMKFSRWRFSVK